MDKETRNERPVYDNPCWLAYIHPYTFVYPDDERVWKLDLSEINAVSYNHAKLLRIVSKIKMVSPNLDGLVCYDGTIAIARHGEFEDKNKAVEYFNKLFLQLNLSGFYVEYVNHRDVLMGQMSEKWSIKNTEMGASANAQLHSKNRWRVGSNMDSIFLDMPRLLTVSELNSKIELGSIALSKIPNLSPKFLNVGLTELRYENWDLVLSNLWITTEQLVDYLWHQKFLNNNGMHPTTEIAGRKASMKDDSRTWSSVVKLEILFQNNLISEDILKNLSGARKARNKLVHEGRAVEAVNALQLVDAVSELLQSITGVKLEFKNRKRQRVINNFNMHIESLFHDWSNLPDENIIELALGSHTTVNAKKGK